MLIKYKEGIPGTFILKNGTEVNYRLKRYNRTRSKLIYYTEKGIAELFKPEMTEEEKIKAAEVKRLHEKDLKRMGYVGEVKQTDILKMNTID
jgi:methyl coenzyme M reductase subunit C